MVIASKSSLATSPAGLQTVSAGHGRRRDQVAGSLCRYRTLGTKHADRPADLPPRGVTSPLGRRHQCSGHASVEPCRPGRLSRPPAARIGREPGLGSGRPAACPLALSSCAAPWAEDRSGSNAPGSLADGNMTRQLPNCSFNTALK